MIAHELGRTNSIVRTMKALRTAVCDADGFGLSDYMMLTRIGEVAVRNGYRYGRKKVDRAINLSRIDEDGECANAEKSFVRATFGVYGRRGRTITSETPENGSEPTHLDPDIPTDQNQSLGGHMAERFPICVGGLRARPRAVGDASNDGT